MDPHPPVKESSLPEIAALVDRLAAAGQADGFRVERFGEAVGIPLIGLTKSASGPAPRLYLSAGIHGDEPAPPRAVLRLLQGRFFNKNCHWHLCPLLNPAAMVRGKREDADGRDLNRDYRDPKSPEIRAHVSWLMKQPAFDLTLCLHEDWEAGGFYLYELNPLRQASLAESIIAAVREVCPIDPADFIDGRPAAGGIIRPESDPARRERWSEAVYLRAHHGPLGYTLETPSSAPLERRIEAHMVAVRTACRTFCLAHPSA